MSSRGCLQRQSEKKRLKLVQPQLISFVGCGKLSYSIADGSIKQVFIPMELQTHCIAPYYLALKV
jgi:hypothetical protein